jgi:hypothetical protein
VLELAELLGLAVLLGLAAETMVTPPAALIATPAASAIPLDTSLRISSLLIGPPLFQ